MKKVVIITIILLVLNIIPSPFLASKSFANHEKVDDKTRMQKDIDVYINSEQGSRENSNNIKKSSTNINDSQIKPGIMVYGEDISELSEEELQYVPEGWRDGVIESEHPYEKNEVAPSPFSNYPNVNNYIKNNKFKAAKVEYDHKDFFTKFNYRNGYGQVEGVVAHETANNKSTILSEIAYMSRNHKNAFVHAFVDGKRVIEIHPTDLGAWGAGRFGNQRFIHVELVRVHNFDDFARSINNYANYIANKLYDYNLGVASAEKSGKGSLWSHRAVSNHLGGTNHVDPHGYFAKYGYNFDDFIKLVTEKHNALVVSKKENTSKLGHIKTEGARIYNDPTNLKKYITASSKYSEEVFYIKSEVTIKDVVYYLINKEDDNKDKSIGWINASNMKTHIHKPKEKIDKVFKIKGEGETFDKIWGGNNNIVFTLASLQKEEFKAFNSEYVGRNVWYQVMLV